MSIESFFTLQTGSVAAQATGSSPATPGMSGLPGLNFLNVLLEHLSSAEQSPISADPASAQSASEVTEKAFGEENLPLTLAEFLEAHPEIEQDVIDFIQAAGLGDDSELLQTLGLNQQILEQGLLPDGDTTLSLSADAPHPSSGAPVLAIFQIDNKSSAEKFTGLLNALKQKIENLMKNGESAILTTNLTPKHITALQNAENGEWPEELKDVNLILIALVSPDHQPATDAKEITDLSQDDQSLANVIALFTPQIQPLKTKDQMTGAPVPASTLSLEVAEETLSGRMNALETAAGGEESEIKLEMDDFEAVLQNTKATAKPSETSASSSVDHNKGTDKASQTVGATVAADWGLTSSTLFGPPTDSLGLYDELAVHAATSQSLHMTTLTSLTTQAPGAMSAHPGTQMIAIAMQKMAADNQNRTIALQLDPPELGRVEVRMIFGKDRTVKAHVIAEKPETYMMLQRDADTLQRVLENSGLETEGGLSFELAEQGFDFDGDNKRGGGHDAGGTGAGADDADDIIETTMTWQVDPQTGYTRYDILV